MIRANPFCTRFVRPGAIEYRFGDDHQDQLQSIYASIKSSARSLIIGPHGSGKSTLIHSLRPLLEQHYRTVIGFQLCDHRPARWPNRRRIAADRWREIRERLDQLDRRDLLIIDGIEQLRAMDRFRLWGRNGQSRPAILATSHRKLVAYSVVFETKLDQHRITVLTEQLIKSCTPPVAGLVRNKLANQDWERPFNLRDFWFDCYDEVQTYQRHTPTR